MGPFLLPYPSLSYIHISTCNLSHPNNSFPHGPIPYPTTTSNQTHPTFNEHHIHPHTIRSIKTRLHQLHTPRYHPIQHPTTLPPLSSDEKATFLNIMVKCFVPDITNEETKFHISFLDNDEAPS